MSKAQNIKAFVQLGEYYDKYRTPEFIDAACKEHTSFTFKSFEDDKSLMVLPIEKVGFDYAGMTTQPRTESIDPSRVNEYALQASEGIVIDGQRVYGIRKPIVVGINPEPYKVHFAGQCGHHRLKAAHAAGFRYIVAKLDRNYSQLAEHEKIDYLMKDNAHAQNGKPNTDKDIKANCRAYMQAPEFRCKEKGRLKAISEKLEDLTLTSESKKLLKEESKKIENTIKDSMYPRVQQWSGGRYGDRKIKSLISEVWNNYNRAAISKIYVYPNEEWKRIYENHSKSFSAHHLCKICNSKSGGLHTRQVAGDVWKLIKNHRKKHGKNPDAIDVLVTVRGCGDIEKLLETRLNVAKELLELILDPRDYRSIKVNFLYYGQSLSNGFSEQVGKLYPHKFVVNRYNKLLQEKLKTLK